MLKPSKIKFKIVNTSMMLLRPHSLENNCLNHGNQIKLT